MTEEVLSDLLTRVGKLETGHAVQAEKIKQTRNWQVAVSGALFLVLVGFIGAFGNRLMAVLYP